MELVRSEAETALIELALEFQSQAERYSAETESARYGELFAGLAAGWATQAASLTSFLSNKDILPKKPDPERAALERHWVHAKAALSPGDKEQLLLEDFVGREADLLRTIDKASAKSLGEAQPLLLQAGHYCAASKYRLEQALGEVPAREQVG